MRVDIKSLLKPAVTAQLQLTFSSLIQGKDDIIFQTQERNTENFHPVQLVALGRHDSPDSQL